MAGLVQWGKPLELEASDEDSGRRFGFSCSYDGVDGVFYSYPKVQPSGGLDASGGRATKGAVAALIDVAEACGARKIALGLGEAHADGAGFVRALLHLGFSVAPCRRKCVFADCALVLEFLIAWPPQDGGWDDGGLSDASTSYDEEDSDCDFSDPSVPDL